MDWVPTFISGSAHYLWTKIKSKQLTFETLILTRWSTWCLVSTDIIHAIENAGVLLLAVFIYNYHNFYRVTLLAPC